MELLELFERTYSLVKVDGFEEKYLGFEQLKKYLDSNFPDKKLIGKSFLGKEIFSLKMGNGPIKILVWSQMHGNESTGTRSMFDVFEFLKTNESWSSPLLKKVTFHFVPMLNPDGATNYTRRNAFGIDINRDFLQEASPEIKVLKKYVEEIKPDFLFNLHDQRTIFNVANIGKPATLSFLAPSFDLNRSINDVRIKSMAVINHMFKGLQKVIPNQVTRFSDEFYPTSTGDNFTKMGYPCILFEAGHFANDYERIKVRKFNALAILLALEKIAKEDNFTKGEYFEIPENNKLYLDIILRNMKIKSSDSEALTDIGIYFVENYNFEKQKLEFISRIEEIGDLSKLYGHVDVDVKGEVYQGNTSPFPKVEELADFKVGSFVFEKGIYKS